MEEEKSRKPMLFIVVVVFCCNIVDDIDNDDDADVNTVDTAASVDAFTCCGINRDEKEQRRPVAIVAERRQEARDIVLDRYR